MPPQVVTHKPSYDAADVTITSVSVDEVEDEFDSLLKSFIEQGRNRKHGVVLFKTVPPKKLGKTAVSRDYSIGSPLSLFSYTAIHRQVYTLESSREDSTITWAQEAESAAGQNSDLELSDFIEMLDSSQHFGTQCSRLKASSSGLRQLLSISNFPVSIFDKTFHGACKDANVIHLAHSWININTSGTPLTIRLPQFKTTAIYFNHRGSQRYWLAIPPEHKSVFETHMRREFGTGFPATVSWPQFMAQSSLWVTPATLQKWGVKFVQLNQAAHELVMFFPDTYHWGYSCGFNVMEWRIFGGSDWNANNHGRGPEETSQSGDVETELQESGKALEADGDTIHVHGSAQKRAQRNEPGINGRGRGKVARYNSPSSLKTRSTLPSSPRSSPEDSTSHRKPSLLETPKQQTTDENSEALIISANPVVSTAREHVISTTNEEFNISDDDMDGILLSNQLSQLETENASLMRQVVGLKVEMKSLSIRKGEYKFRLLEREKHLNEKERQLIEKEKYITDLEARLVVAKNQPWTEMMEFVVAKAAEASQAEGSGGSIQDVSN